MTVSRVNAREMDALNHLFRDVRPFDWLMFAIEVAVVVLILYEVIAGQKHRRQDAQHIKSMNAKTVQLSKLLTKGERLQQSAPNAAWITDLRVIPLWIAEVQIWIEATQYALTEKSKEAAADFMLVADADKISVYVESGPGFFVTGEAAAPYRSLVAHLENLRQIIRRPEAYF